MSSIKNKRRRTRVRNLIAVCCLSAIILVVSTYAWFIGLQDVNVTSFDVEIASTESLLLSLDGEKWSTEISISKETLDDVSYEGHTNNWGGTGLYPVSSVGVIDKTASRLELYEKAGMTATPDSYGFVSTAGGFRLLTSQVNNYQTDNAEQNGYVVFDLFVKNFSGNQYLENLNDSDEEAIYLTTNSKVKVAADGVANTGIENSVRVAFAQIGRVNGFTTDVEAITGIKCDGTDINDVNVTGICRTAQIWEPNDTAHVTNAISWYTNACRTRKSDGLDISNASSYNSGTVCNTVANGTAYNTYAINRTIGSENNVDVYDGADYNTYTASDNGTSLCENGTTPTTEEACTAAFGTWSDGCTGSGEKYCNAIGGTYRANGNAKLYAYPYFTDSMKMLTGTRRPAFMKLAPNSITKIRVYIYIEGQDIDNYDYAAIGKKISVNFGFTKQRINEEDINYQGPALNMGTCTGGNVPATEASCVAANGTWNGTSCYGTNREYCDAIEGTFVSSTSNYGSCAVDTENVPTTEAECTVAHGTWTEEDGGTPAFCSGTTREYCDAVGGVFTLDETNNTSNQLVPGECSGDSQVYCLATFGTWTPADGDTPASCTDNVTPITQTSCRAAYGTWTPTE